MIQPTWHPSAPELRQFGFAACIAFTVLGALLRWWFDLAALPWIVWALGAYCGLAAVLAPFKVFPVYLLVTALAVPIGLVVGHVVLGLVYFGLMTPLGLVMRMAGRDALRLRKPNVASYWNRRTPATTAASYYRQS
jgi:hypothetical protein